MSRAKKNNPRRRSREQRFDATVEAMRRRIESLLGDAGKAPRREIPEDVAQNLQSSLEELQVAEEELRQQNEALGAAQQAVLQERARYAGLFEFAPDGYLVTDMQGIIREANRAAGTLLGRPSSLLVSKPLGVYVSPDDRRLLRTDINALAHGTREARMELRLRRHKAGEFWAAVSVAVVDDGKKPAGLRWLFRDVTERKQAESALRQARDLLEARVEERTEDLAKAVEDLKAESHRREDLARFPAENPAPVLRVAKDGALLYANPAAAGLLKDWKAAVGKPVPEAWRARVRKALRSKKTQETDVEQCGRVFSVSFTPLASEGYVNLYFRDVTERDAAERAILRAKEEWEWTFNTVPDLIAILDRDCQVLRVNRAMAERLGTTPEEAVGKHCHEVVHGLDAPPGFCPHAMTCSDGKEHVAEVQEDRLGGDFLVSTTPLRDSKGALIGTVHVAHNITERKKREEELARLNRTLTALSHADRALVRAGTEKEFLDEACRIVVEDCGHAMVWIGFAEPDAAKSVRPAAWAGFEDGYLDSLKLTWDDAPRGRGPTGSAIRNGKPCACVNMLSDPAFAPWREEAIKRGYASSLALPLSWGKRVLGAITIYFPEAGGVSDDELRLLSALADDVAFGVEALRTREAHAKAAQSVRESEARYRSLFENMLNGFAYCRMIYDRKGRPTDFEYIAVNEAFGDLTGLKDVEGRRVSEVVPGIRESDPGLFETYGRVARTGKPESFEVRVAALDMWFSIAVYSPAPDHFVAVFEVITARKKAEEALRESEERFKAIASNTPDHILVQDRDLRYTFVANPQMGLTEADMVGKTDFDFLAKEDAEKLTAVKRKVMETGAATPYATSLTSPKGAIEHFEGTYVPKFDAEGRPDGIIGYFSSVTERKRAEALLRARVRLSETAQRVGADELLQEALDAAESLTGSRIGFFHFVDEDQETLTLRAWSTNTIRNMCTAEGKGTHYAISKAGVWADCFHARAPVFHNDYASLPHRKGMPEGHAQVVRELVVPILRNASVVAIVGVGNKPSDYTTTDADILRDIATPIMDLVARKKAEEAVEKGLRRFELLAETAGELLVTWEPQKAVEDLCRRVMDHLDCQAFFNFLVDEKAGRLHLNACGGIPEETARRIEWLDYGVAVCGCVARDGERIIAEHIPTTPDPRTEMIKSFGIKAYCCHPLFGAGGKVLGTLSFGTKTRETFSEEDVSLMSAVTDQVAAAMARMKSEREVREVRDGLEVKVRERTSELESAMQALRDSSAYARTLIEASLDPLVTISPEGKITDVNLATVIVIGVPREGLIGTDFADYFTEPDRARAGYREAFAEGMVTEYPLTLRHRNGRLTDVVYNATVYRDASGAVQGVFAAARDVTERNRTRRAIEVSEARHRAVMEEAAEGILLTDGEGNIVEANVSVSRITGRSHEEIVGRNVAEFLSPEDREKRPLPFEEVRAGKTVSEERWITRTDGAPVDIEASARILQDGRILVVVRDITERRRAEDLLRGYQARLKSMATEMALLEDRQRSSIARDLHDGISQTLAAAKMRLDLMKAKGAQSADFAEVHRLVAQSLEESRSLTIDLCPPVLYDLGLEAAIEYLVERFAGESGIETEFESDGEPKPLADGLRAMLYRSTRELLHNAAKHSRAKKIRVSTRRENGSVVVEVEDDGTGFDASSVRAGMHPSGGFGLFSIREQLNYLGGSLDVRSEPGAGTRATLTAPLAPEPAQSGETP